MTYRKFIFILVIVVIAGTFAACKSSRGIIKAPIREEGPEFLFSKLIENEFKFHSFEAKFNIEYNQGRIYNDFKGQIRIIKDSIIWVNFNQGLGIEIARVMITQDSVKFLNRIHNQYLIADYDFLNNFLNTNIDFGILQSIILGNDFEYYENARFKASIDGGNYKLTTTGRSKLKKYVKNNSDAERVLLQSTWLNPETFKILQIKLKELTKDSKKLIAQYEDFQSIGDNLFPNIVKYNIELENEIYVKLKYNRISLDEKLTFPFKVPSKYSPVK